MKNLFQRTLVGRRGSHVHHLPVLAFDDVGHDVFAQFVIVSFGIVTINHLYLHIEQCTFHAIIRQDLFHGLPNRIIELVSPIGECKHPPNKCALLDSLILAFLEDMDERQYLFCIRYQEAGERHG